MNRLIQQAFTLIELLVVIAIIGILSGLIVIATGGVTNKANIAKAQVFSNSLRNSLMMSLVAEYKFDGSGVADGGTATTAYTQDTWGSNSGSIGGAPLVRSGSNCVYGSCLNFSGSNDYISLPALGIPINGPATISGWFYFNDLAKTRGITMYLYSNFLYQHTANNYIYINGGSDYFNWTPSLNVWYYLTMTYSGNSSTAKLYVNGIPINCTLQSGSSVPAFTNTISGSGVYAFNGLIDEVRIYNASIPISQIKEQYCAGLNNLLAKNQITPEDYINRINESIAKK